MGKIMKRVLRNRTITPEASDLEDNCENADGGSRHSSSESSSEHSEIETNAAVETLSYEQQREVRIQERMEMLKTLGLNNMRHSLETAVPQFKKKVIKKKVKTRSLGPSRRSNRLIEFQQQREMNGDSRRKTMNFSELVKLAEESAARGAVAAEMWKTDRREEHPVPDGDVAMLAHVHENFDKENCTKILDSLQTMSRRKVADFEMTEKLGFGRNWLDDQQQNMSGSLVPDRWATDDSGLGAQMKSMSWSTPQGDVQGIKVTPSRAFSVAVLPITERLFVGASDKWGNIGYTSFPINWQDPSCHEEPLVGCFRIQNSPITCLVPNPFKPAASDLYFTSYDGCVRSCDFERGLFREFYRDDDATKCLDFISPDSLIIASHSGSISLCDIRAPKGENCRSLVVEGKNLRTVSVHPTNRHLFALCDIYGVGIYDVRRMSSKTLKINHPVTSFERKKGFCSAYFSPVTGDRLLACGTYEDILFLDSGSDQMANATLQTAQKSVMHNNWTGRWLSKFQPKWHPSSEQYFITGTMDQIRKSEIYRMGSYTGVVVNFLTGASSTASVNAWHPSLAVCATGTSSGRVHIYSSNQIQPPLADIYY